MIRIKEEHAYLTMFDTRYGKIEYIMMPFGVVNSKAAFFRFKNVIFSDILEKHVSFHLVDIVIFSEEPSLHAVDVKNV